MFNGTHEVISQCDRRRKTAITTADFTLTVTLDVLHDQAIQQVTEPLKTGRFGLLTDIDVHATLKKKLDVDFR